MRNVCAHHGRLFNRNLLPASTVAFRTIDGLESLPEGQSDKLFGALLVMAFMLNSISPGTSWTAKVSGLVQDEYAQLHLRSVTEMGFPHEWAGSFSRLRIKRHKQCP